MLGEVNSRCFGLLPTIRFSSSIGLIHSVRPAPIIRAVDLVYKLDISILARAYMYMLMYAMHLNHCFTMHYLCTFCYS